MIPSEIGVQILVGDFVIDHMDGDTREIASFTIHDDDDATVYMVDGGLMGLNEITSDMIRLESEVF